MDITVYLPDELAHRAKARSDINLSRMLRDALTTQFKEEDTVAQLLEDAREFKLTLETENGTTYTGRITARRLGENDAVEVYLTDQGNVVVYDVDKLKYYVEDSDVGLNDLITDQEVYLEVMGALGREATIDLDV